MSGKRVRAFLGGLAVLGVFGAGVYYLQGGRMPWMAEKPKPHHLAEGTPVTLALLEAISSGGTSRGARAPAVVLEDVTAPSGVVLIKAGTPVEIEVTRSRGSTAMTSLINQPARLSIQMGSVEAVDGQTADLLAVKGSADDLEVTRGLTKQENVGDAVKKLWENPETQGSLKALQGRLTGENPQADLRAPDLKKAVEDVAKEMNMPETARALRDPGAWRALTDALGKAGGGDLSGLGSGEAALALGALKELGSLAGTVDDTLKGVFKGSNITLPVGARLTGYLAKDLTVMAGPETGKRG